jgi:hypothetical protein
MRRTVGAWEDGRMKCVVLPARKSFVSPPDESSGKGPLEFEAGVAPAAAAVRKASCALFSCDCCVQVTGALHVIPAA